jgi:hypothetical protein
MAELNFSIPSTSVGNTSVQTFRNNPKNLRLREGKAIILLIGMQISVAYRATEANLLVVSGLKQIVYNYIG